MTAITNPEALMVNAHCAAPVTSSVATDFAKYVAKTNVMMIVVKAEFAQSYIDQAASPRNPAGADRLAPLTGSCPVAAAAKPLGERLSATTRNGAEMPARNRQHRKIHLFRGF